MRKSTRRLVRRATTVACASSGAALAGAGLAARAHAQGTTVVTGGRLADWSDAAVGSEEENYLRVLQVAGVARPRPWSIRPFGPNELGGILPDTARHPWQARAAFGDPRSTSALRWTGADAGGVYNSAVPYSMNDGGIWTGRGVTAYARGGVTARWRWFSARLEPAAFWASNQSYPIAANGYAGAQRFGDALNPAGIDLPQRFGARRYARVDPGQSTVRVDAFGLAAGFTTANEWWGPALVDPQILGDNAAGYPRLFLGTSKPVSLGVATVHAVLQTGRLSQSAYSTMPADSAYRTGVGLAAVATVRGVPGLEVGAARFLHEAWEGAGHALSRAGAPFQGFFGTSGGTAGAQNQITSVFARWALVPARVEVWGEYMRNDGNLDARDLAGEPDHDSGYTVGLRRVWRRADNTLSAFRVEALNTRITHLDRVRLQGRPYEHGTLRQGHTELGQALGSEAGQGGGAQTVGYDVYRPDGRWTVELARRVVQTSLAEGAPEGDWDVRYLARVERLRFGRSADLFLAAGPVVEFNRNFGHDAYGVRLDAGWRFGRLPGPRTR